MKMKMLLKCLAFALALPCLAHAGEGPRGPWEMTKGPGDREILKAAYEGDLSAVEAYLAKGGKPDLSNRYGMTILSMAAEQNRTAVMQALLKAGADVNAKADGQQTPIYWAARENHIPAMKLLIDAGADVNAKDRSGWTPLMANCYNTGNRRYDQSTDEGFNLLLKAGADLNARTNSGDAVIHFCARGHHQQIRQLIALKMDVNQRDSNGETALHHVLRQGSLIRIRESREEQESLKETVQALLKAGADVNAKGKTMPVFGEKTPLMAAAETPLTELADILLKAGADVKLADNEGRTALWIALRQERPGMAQALLKAGADPKAQDKEGTTALMVACRYAFAEIVQALIAAKVDVNLADEKGKTALMWAASADKAPWADSILGRMKAKSEFKKRQTEIVKMLIAAGADVNAKDTYGHTALDVAETSDVKKVLREATTEKGKKK